MRESGARTIVVLAGVVIVLAGLREASSFCIPVLAAAFLAAVSAPLVGWLESRARMPRVAAVLLTFVWLVAILAVFVLLAATSLSGFAEALPRYQAAFSSLAAVLTTTAHELGLPILDDLLTDVGIAQAAMALVGPLLSQLTSAVTNALLVALLLAFMLFEIGPGRAKLDILLGGPHEEVERLAEAADELQRYLVLKTALSVLTGVLCGVWFAFCGLDFAILWALLVFVLNYIPTIGAAIAAIPPTLVALLTLGPGAAVAVLTGHLVVNFVIGNVFEPRVMGQTLGLSTLVVFLSMLFWGWLWGPIGALFGVPLTMVLKATFATFESTRWLAVMLGSRQWVERKRREWGWITKEERQSIVSSPGLLAPGMRASDSSPRGSDPAPTPRPDAPRPDAVEAPAEAARDPSREVPPGEAAE